MGISIDNVWAKAQRLSPSERLALSRRLAESVTETETARRERVAKEMDQFFGGWAEDERTTDEIMAQIRAGRTTRRFGWSPLDRPLRISTYSSASQRAKTALP